MDETAIEIPEATEIDSTQSPAPDMRWFYGFFFVSGFCSLLYELVWVRLAMAQFGVTSAVTATFISVFMAGLGLGSWLAAKWLSRHKIGKPISPVVIYALTESAIGTLALAVPLELRWGHALLLRFGADASWTSFRYTFLSGAWLGISLIPACACMGATFPFAMSALKTGGAQQKRSFSYLYLANVLGAMVGVTLPLLLVEAFGFSATLRIGALVNLGIAACALAISRSYQFPLPKKSQPAQSAPSNNVLPRPVTAEKWYLFAVGASSMGMEVVWVRLFTPYLGTVIYAFAGILGIYLIATFLGAKIYRSGSLIAGSWIWFVMAAGGFLPIIAADPMLSIPRLLRLPLGILLPAMAAGFTTPMLVDLVSAGDAALAGSAYALNVLGCIVGPLIAGFVLLPYLGERWALLILAAPWVLIGGMAKNSPAPQGMSGTQKRMLAITLAATGIAFAILCQGYEGKYPVHRVLRDSTATVIAAGETREDQQLLINGYGMSRLTAVTKTMAHLPLAFAEAPRKILIICFGMGTTYRSALSWGVEATAVDLTPSVPRFFSYFYPDAEALLASPRSRVVIDDGRRFLERSRGIYDVITIDPPPPVEAAGSSLLYTVEFYTDAKRHLRAGGILHQWLPGGDDATLTAVTRALLESFPYVRAFASLDKAGIHFVASDEPLPNLTASQLASHLPSAAVKDFLEWGPASSAEVQFHLILRWEIPLAQLLARSPRTGALRDDHPINEYFLTRRLVTQPEFFAPNAP